VKATVEILFLLIPLSVVLAVAIGAGFWWAVTNGQFDDLASPAHRILTDDDRPAPADDRRAPEQKTVSAALMPVNPVEPGRR
jgi:cbb3-type cytochrome oxidase maturation protein